MKRTSASQYCGALAELLGRVEATGSTGTALGVDDAAGAAVSLIQAVRALGRKVLLIGNGGSAAIASHVQNDLQKAAGVRALVFNEAPILTALANDEGYARVFEQHIVQWAEPGDLLVAISSSGRSENIVRAAAAAGARGCRVLTFSGFDANNTLRGLGNLNFYVPSRRYGFVELAHGVLLHHLTDSLLAQVVGRAAPALPKDSAYEIQIVRPSPDHRRGRLRRRRAGA